MSHKVTLYVKSVKTVTGTEEIERETFGGQLWSRPDRIKIEGSRAGGTFRLRRFETETEPTYEFVFSDDQQRIIEMVKEITSKHGLELEVVDVTKENILHRAIQRELKKIKTFPTLITDSGELLESNLTKEQIKDFLSKATETRES